ncbi:MAG: outer membrane protein [Pseudolabrys sp.]
MKRLILAGLGALAMVSMIGAANAADMGRRQQVMPAKAPAYAPYNWTGFYIGINGGGGWGNSEWSNTAGAASADTSGGLVGGTLGFNYQMGQAVFGLEGDLDWSNIRGSTTSGVCVGGTCETRNNWLGTVRGRIGYAFDRFLPYLTGGLAVGDIKAEPVGLGSSTETKAGWTLGGGLEFAIAGPWTAKVEYLYVDLGKMTCDTAVCGTPATDVDFRANVVRAGLNYRF